MTTRHVLVLNHFAVPIGHPGGTRHVELFGRLPGWSHVIIASRLNYSTGRRQDPEAGFLPVPVIPHRGNGVGRVLNWASYFVTATFAAIRQPRPDVVYASSPHLLAGLAGWTVAKLRRARFILEVRDLWPRVLVDMGQLSETATIYRALARLERFLYRRADAIVVLAAGARPSITALGTPASKIIHIPNAADPHDFEPTASRDELRRRYGFTRLTAVYAGAHGPANGLDLVLNAAAELTHHDIEFVLIGSGVEKSRLQRRAFELGLGGTVRFMDPVPKSVMPDLLAAADIGIHSLADVPLFRYGVSPNKIYDYMAAALPIVTNAPGEASNLVADAGAGIGVEPTTLAQGIKDLASRTPDERAVMGARGRAWLLEGRSRTAAAARLLELLSRVGGDVS